MSLYIKQDGILEQFSNLIVGGGGQTLNNERVYPIVT